MNLRYGLAMASAIKRHVPPWMIALDPEPPGCRHVGQGADR